MRLAAATLEAYDRWAPLYAPTAHNPLMRVEQRAMLEQWPEVAGRRALDLACGTGRYAKLLENAKAAHVVALDFSAAMLKRAITADRVRASMMQLPFASRTFDVVVCGLAIGHAISLPQWMGEAARVLAPGGTLLYSDFHPEAGRAGLKRAFKDQHDRTCTVPHGNYDVASQKDAAAAAGLIVEIVREIRVGIELREDFPQSERFYREWHGLPIVLVLRARK